MKTFNLEDWLGEADEKFGTEVKDILSQHLAPILNKLDTEKGAFVAAMAFLTMATRLLYQANHSREEVQETVHRITNLVWIASNLVEGGTNDDPVLH